MRVAQVIVDIPARELDRPFDYLVPDGCRRRRGRVRACSSTSPTVRRSATSSASVRRASAPSSSRSRLVLGGPFFGEAGARCRRRGSPRSTSCPLSEALRLFMPPGGTPQGGARGRCDGAAVWTLKRAGVGPVDDRWAELTAARPRLRARARTPPRSAPCSMRCAAGPVRVAELAADLGAVDGRAARRSTGLGAVRRRAAGGGMRDAARPRAVGATARQQLTAGQRRALDGDRDAAARRRAVVVARRRDGLGQDRGLPARDRGR